MSGCRWRCRVVVAEHSGLLTAVRPLADRFHVVLYDQRGSLRSPAPDSTISLPRMVRDLEGLRRQLGQERLTLLAHSMGSVLAYAYLAARQRIGLASRMLARPERWRALSGGPSFYNPRVGAAIERHTSSAERDRLWARFLPALAGFTGAVTVVLGDADFIDAGAALWRHASTQLPRVRLVVVPDAGHSAWLDAPTRFDAVVTEALAHATAR